MKGLTPGAKAMILPGGSRAYVGTVCIIVTAPHLCPVLFDDDGRWASNVMVCQVEHHDGVRMKIEDGDRWLAAEQVNNLLPLDDPDQGPDPFEDEKVKPLERETT